MCQPDPELDSPCGRPPVAETDDERLLRAFAPMVREVEENIELYFSDLAAVSDSISGECFDDDTHDNFYVASREVISQGLDCQLKFLRDNAPHAFAILLRKAGLSRPAKA